MSFDNRSERVRYFRIDNILTGEPTGVFRKRRDDTSLFLEQFDPKTGDWVERFETLGRYIYKGEVGAEPIDAAEAERLMRSGNLESWTH